MIWYDTNSLTGSQECNATKTSISDFWMLLTHWIWTFRTEETSFSAPVERVETEVCNPTFKVSPLGLKNAVSTRFAGTENWIPKRGAIKNIFIGTNLSFNTQSSFNTQNSKYTKRNIRETSNIHDYIHGSVCVHLFICVAYALFYYTSNVHYSTDANKEKKTKL